MTEAEAWEVAHIIWGNAVSIMAIYVSILTGYLVVAYTAGKTMTKTQITIVNMLYIGLSVSLLLSFLAFTFNASKMEHLALAMATQSEIIPRPSFAYAVAGFLSFCLVATLKFMWDERAKNGEKKVA